MLEREPNYRLRETLDSTPFKGGVVYIYIYKKKNVHSPKLSGTVSRHTHLFIDAGLSSRELYVGVPMSQKGNRSSRSEPVQVTGLMTASQRKNGGHSSLLKLV